jgi:hypothetical protein
MSGAIPLLHQFAIIALTGTVLPSPIYTFTLYEFFEKHSQFNLCSVIILNAYCVTKFTKMWIEATVD